jgi:hypothetical protein
MTTRYFRWDDPSAPTLDGQAGTFIDLMIKCLVGTAGVAYGTGADEKLAAGWSIAYQDLPGKIVFRNDPTLGSGCYLRILDDGSDATYGARVARMQVYESMSDIDTGTAAASSISGGVYIRKSEALSSAARVWVVCADERTMYFNLYSAGSTPLSASTGDSYSTLGGAGDYEPMIAGDPGVFVAGRHANGTIFAVSGMVLAATPVAAAVSIGVGSFGVTRDTALSASASAVDIPFTAGSTTSQAIGNSTLAMMTSPAPGTSGDFFIPALIKQGAALRGKMRGLYAPITRIAGNKTMADEVIPLAAGASRLVIMSGSGIAAGGNSQMRGRVAVETDLAW